MAGSLAQPLEAVETAVVVAAQSDLRAQQSDFVNKCWGAYQIQIFSSLTSSDVLASTHFAKAGHY